jgi:hypothetical protein
MPVKIAYSMLLREFVEAEEVEPGDCEKFLVTCPCCREALFKKTRARHEGGETHFLSHYRADSADAKECELRVETLSHEQIEHFSMAGRGQALDGFMSVLKDAIIRGQAFLMPPGEYQKSMNRLLSRPVYQQFVPYGLASINALLKFPDPRKTVADMLASFPRFESRSPFWHRRQASYILDVLRHLTIPQAQGNMRVLVAAGYLNIAVRADEYRRDRSQLMVPGYDPIPGVNLIEAMVDGKSPAALKHLTARWSGADKATSDAAKAKCLNNVYIGIVSELIGPIIGALGAVPFPDLARDRNATFDDNPELTRLKQLMDEAMAMLRDLPSGPQPSSSGM